MNKKTLITRLFVLVALILSIVVAIQMNQVNKPFTSEEQCDITLKSCTIPYANKTIGLSFEQEPQTEEELFLNFTFDDNIQIKRAWIEGLNMYMGKTPILFEDADNPRRGVTFLGSCNLSEMNWAIYVEFEDTANPIPINKNDTETFVVSASFYTYLP